MRFTVLSCVVVIGLISAVTAQSRDRYQAGGGPGSLYLPPTTTTTTTTTTRRPTTQGYVYTLPPTTARTTTTTKKPYEAEEDILAEGLGPPDDGWKDAQPFEYRFAVKDDLSRNDFGHDAESNGDVVKGEYRTLLPDGRIQLVKYTADWKNGYTADITYQ